MPAIISEERRDPAIAIPAEPFGQADNRRCQGVLIVSPYGLLALGRTVLAENLAGKALRDRELGYDMVDAAATAGPGISRCG